MMAYSKNIIPSGIKSVLILKKSIMHNTCDTNHGLLSLKSDFHGLTVKC